MATVETVNNSPNVSGFWSTVGNIKIGVIPLPLYAILAAVIFTASFYDKLPADMVGGFATIMILGMFLGEVGARIPILKNIGGPAILAIFVPSTLVFLNLLNPAMLKSITAIMKTDNFLYLYISSLVVGSILGMNRKVLIQGFLRMFVPLIVGTIASIVVGSLVGTLFGFSIKHTFFYIVVPIIGGGIGEGVLPLSLAYSEILKVDQSALIPQLTTAAVLGNVVAIVTAGFLKRLGEKKQHLTGNGMLVKGGKDEELLKESTTIDKPIEFPLMGAGLLLAVSFYIFGSVANMAIAIPGAILMIFAAAIVKALKIMPPKMEQGAYHWYKFVSNNLTFPLMVGIGVLYTPLSDVVKLINPAYLVIVICTVLAMVSSGFFVGKLLKMYPIESALVTACHSGLGGTGDVAILSSANRIELMPFAQISTRIGGASMIVIATILMRMFGN
ncbi:2-hydroxycarboxylate transporter family protein [Desulfitobacterium sp.]|uniref:2-hydroxycarboxylate transporter family protein n=1 Tax=Desulfitobacterium sp. TaxID=49981 RepID=UPI002B2013DD|nr:2-hydroxycarboxylate transporter family protein [Desulfitobacterium sp.]MEA4902218.1 2-hydroxycarboxylate transporter family protein [Desulfitobacterium sp.]